jgi:TP901-1 family phage major tail protein
MSRLTAEELQNLPENPDPNIAEAGKDVLLYLGKSGSGDEEVFALVGGQRNSTIEMTAGSLDGSHKGSGGWTTAIPGMKSWKSSFDGLQIMNDEGAQIMEHCFRYDKQAHTKFVYPDGSFQIGWAHITEFSRDNPHDGIATIKSTLEGVGPISEITPAAEDPAEEGHTNGETNTGTTDTTETNGETNTETTDTTETNGETQNNGEG